MALLVLCAAPGSPGVTTTALGLTLAWPRRALLVDADREPAQAVLAGYLGGADPGTRGLVGLARAHREGRPLDVRANALPLSDDGSRGFLPGFANPGSVALFATVWPALSHALAAHAARDGDVIVDAGRIGAGLPRPLTDVADAVLVTTGTSLRALAALRLYLPALAEVGDDLGLLVVGPGRPYTAAEVARQFGRPVRGSLPWSPAGAATWSDAAPASRASRHLGAAYARTAVELAALVHHGLPLAAA